LILFAEEGMSQSAATFRRLHSNTTPLRLPNAWDAGSARLFESLGATAIATTSAGVAWALGYQDGRLLPVNEVVDAASRMARVLTIPLSVDVENGYSDNPQKVADSVMRVVDLGVAGINIEDGPEEATLLASKTAWDAILASAPTIPPVTPRSSAQASPDMLKKIVGRHEFAPGTLAEIRVHDSKLELEVSGSNSMSLKAGQPVALSAVAADEFELAGVRGDRLRVDRNKHGRVVGITLNPGPWPVAARRIP
jgi:hypothetical protein